MVNPVSISRISPGSTDSEKIAATGSGKPAGGPTFREVLEKSLGEVNDLQHVAEEKIQKFATGEVTDLREVMVAAEEANLAFQFTLEIRNKIVEAYQEISRLQV